MGLLRMIHWANVGALSVLAVGVFYGFFALVLPALAGA